MKNSTLVVSLVAVGLMATCIGLGVYTWNKYGPAIREMGQVVVPDATQFASGADNNMCVQEALARYPADTGMTRMLKRGLFLNVCLDSSRRVENFCDGVPRESARDSVRVWSEQQCAGKSNDQRECRTIIAAVPQHCSERK